MTEREEKWNTSAARRNGHGIRLAFSCLTISIVFAGLLGASPVCEDIERSTEDFSYLQAQAGIRFLQFMRFCNLESMENALYEGWEQGAFPEWILEYGQNVLRSCSPNAVLFTGSHVDTNTLWYLQYIRKQRRDIAVIPIGLLNRPWFLWTLASRKRLVPSCVSLSWDKNKILFTPPDRWKPEQAVVRLSGRVCRKYRIPGAKIVEWPEAHVLHSGRKAYANPNLAVMLNIINTNKWKRPVYFAMGCNSQWLMAVGPFLRLNGIVYELLPKKHGHPDPELNVPVTQNLLLEPANFTVLKKTTSSYTAYSDTVLINYIHAFEALGSYYDSVGDKGMVGKTVQTMRDVFGQSILIQPELLEKMESSREKPL